ncbi:PIN domain-containing protein [Asticcacaulis excentricus]|uniref:PIN domain-containing protein n=1 Tax=Asticcacaulis excentricus TaxID=78587 RepID=UPI000F825A45|nr:PIN domain-containing protein [Asticcacaulis excentricus]
MVILDTNVVSELMKAQPHPSVVDWLNRIGDIRIATTAITVAEITYGLERLPDGARKAELKRAFLTLLEVLGAVPLDESAAYKAGQFRALRDATGRPSTASDMMIAGIAAVAGAQLATRNTKDFDRLPLTITDPWAAN